MDILGFNVLVIVKNLIVGVLGGSLGFFSIFAWKIAKKKFRPIHYAMKLYEAADKVIEHIDDKFIDKIKNKKLKKTIQDDLIKALNHRRDSLIPEFIKRISD